MSSTKKDLVEAFQAKKISRRELIQGLGKLGIGAAAASFMMLPLVLTLAVGAPLAGQLLDRIGPRSVVQGGLSLTAAGLVLLALLPLDLVSFYAACSIIGFGLSALLGAPLRYITLQEAGDEQRGAGQPQSAVADA